jgi:DEAD/DEAH box helicase
VLDEADHMADIGFLPVVSRLLDAIPPRGQRMLFSATLDHDVDVLARRYLSNPGHHAVDPAAPPPRIEHHMSGHREFAGGLGRSWVLFTDTHLRYLVPARLRDNPGWASSGSSATAAC